MHKHTVNQLVAYYLPETKNEYLSRLKTEDDKKWEKLREKWNRLKEGDCPKLISKKTFQTLCFLRVQDIFTLCLDRAKKGLRQYRKSCLFITSHLLAAQYNYHIGNTLDGSLKVDAIRAVLLRLNDTFTEPYNETMIDDIINELVCKFNKAEKDGNNKDKEDKHFYHFRNVQIIAELRIQPYEEKLLSVTIGEKEKKYRFTMRQLRKKEVRAKAKEERIMSLLFKLKRYLKQNKTGKQIADKMELSLRTINRLKSKLKEIGESTVDAFINSLRTRKENTVIRVKGILKNNDTLKEQILAHLKGHISFSNIIPGLKGVKIGGRNIPKG